MYPWNLISQLKIQNKKLDNILCGHYYPRAFSGSDQAIPSISIKGEEDDDKVPVNMFQIEIEDATGEKTTKISSWPSIDDSGPVPEPFLGLHYIGRLFCQGGGEQGPFLFSFYVLKREISGFHFIFNCPDLSLCRNEYY